LLEKSTRGLVLLVEAVPEKGKERGPLWRLSITGNNATARREPARSVPEYKRDFRNARCEKGDNRCLHIGSDSEGKPVLDIAIDIETTRKTSRSQYRRLSDLLKISDLLALHRAMFHPDIPDAILLAASCGKK
jgi:hypothetical protein